jgi:hypothetical protein
MYKMPPVDIYLPDLNGTASITILAGIDASATSVLLADEEVHFYLPLEYMRNLFNIKTDGYQVIMDASGLPNFTCHSNISDLRFLTYVDPRLHLNAGKANVVKFTKPTGPTVGGTYGDIADRVWYTSENVTERNLANDYVRFLAYDKFKNFSATGAFNNVNELHNDLYSKLEVVWANQKVQLFKGTTIQKDASNNNVINTNGVIQMNYPVSSEIITTDVESSICKTIYEDIMAKDSSRFENLNDYVYKDVSGVEMKDADNRITFTMPFMDGDTLNYKITVSGTNFGHAVSRSYLVRLIISDDASHGDSNGQLTVITSSQSDFSKNNVGVVSLCGVPMEGLNYNTSWALGE